MIIIVINYNKGSFSKNKKYKERFKNEINFKQYLQSSKKKKKEEEAFNMWNNFFKQFVSYFSKVSTCSYNVFAKGWKRDYTK